MSQDVIEDIWFERRRQEQKWGDEAHDDTHSQQDWHDIIHRLLDEAEDGGRSGNDAEYRRIMVQVAAVVVAAVEAHDRLHDRGVSS